MGCRPSIWARTRTRKMNDETKINNQRSKERGETYKSNEIRKKTQIGLRVKREMKKKSRRTASLKLINLKKTKKTIYRSYKQTLSITFILKVNVNHTFEKT